MADRVVERAIGEALAEGRAPTKADIKRDPELQPREELDPETVENYSELIADGARSPPVIVFRVGKNLLLVDGWHRWVAHERAGKPQIEAIVQEGTREQALRYALRANAKHGKPRSQITIKRAYDIAVKRGLVRAHDVRAVMDVLNVRETLAKELTAEARKIHDAALRSVALMMASRQMRQAEISERLGVPKRTLQHWGISRKNAAGGEIAVSADVDAIAREIREAAKKEVAEEVRAELLEQHKKRVEEIRAEIEQRYKEECEADAARLKAEAEALEAEVEAGGREILLPPFSC